MIKMILKGSLLFLASSSMMASAADLCTQGAVAQTLGPVSSLNIASLGERQVSGGLSCPVLIKAFSTEYLKYRADNIPSVLMHSDGVNSAAFSVRDGEYNNIVTGSEKILTNFDWIGILGSNQFDVVLFVTLNPNQYLKPGVYTVNLNLRWFYRITYTGIPPFAIYNTSPGWSMSWGTVNWGTGNPATIPLRLEVTADCNIKANNIDFGKMPLVSKFDPVTGSVQVMCSAQTPYTVGVSNGLNYSSMRRMKNTGSADYINYEIYKNTGGERWGSEGAQRWQSTAATTMPGIHDGKTSQTYSYTAKVEEAENKAVPAGTYKDTLTIEVKF